MTPCESRVMNVGPRWDGFDPELRAIARADASGTCVVASAGGEDVAYVARLRASGVPCELDVIDGAFHGFDSIAPKTAVAQAFFARQCISLHNAFREHP